MDFSVVILAGGEGKRLRPLTYYCCKPMLWVNDKPILTWQTDHIRQFTDDIIIISGHREQDIKSSFPIISNYENGILKSQVQGITDIQNILSDNFFVIYGDLIFFEDLKEMYKFHTGNEAIATIKYHYRNVSSLIESNNDVVVQFKENARIKVNSGIYLFNKRIFNYIQKDDTDFPKHVFPRLKENFYVLPCDHYRIAIDSLDRLEQAQKDMLYLAKGQACKTI